MRLTRSDRIVTYCVTIVNDPPGLALLSVVLRTDGTGTITDVICRGPEWAGKPIVYSELRE